MKAVSVSDTRRDPNGPAPLRIVGIGASAGGLEAFTLLLAHLPVTGNVAYVLVQHLDPTHRSLLSELLARTTELPVSEITADTPVEPGRAYVIPPDSYLAIANGILRLSPRRKQAEPARTIDRFLESLAADQGPNAIGVILSGAGSDGAKGLRAIKAAGGITFAQEESSSKYDSMPRSAIATGSVDFVLPPPKIAAEIARILKEPANIPRRAAANARSRRNRGKTSVLRGGRAEWPAPPEDLELRKIFLLLRSRTGTDFSFYRPNTIRRRMARRMVLHKLGTREEYLRYLREHPAEIDALYQDLLINVTSFFRNPGVFERLKKKIFPRLVKSRADRTPLRFWVAGCSTGQEAYSLAIAYSEFAEKNSSAVPIQIFATDLNASVLEHARAGRYSRAQLTGLSPARQQRHLVKEGDQYRVTKPIRDMVIFAQQNLLTDPPFTRVDLISCRNMLIYFEPALQQKIIPSFHYALTPGGALVLGSSESVGQFGNLFMAVDKTARIYLKQAAASWLRYERPPVPPAVRGDGQPTRAAGGESTAADACREADRLVLAKYSPAAVLVNEEGEILHFRGEVRRYLDLPAGKATFYLWKMVREPLAYNLQKAFQRARDENKLVRETNLRSDDRGELLAVEISPVRSLKTRCFLIVFERTAVAAPARPARLPAGRKAGRADGTRLAVLKREFAETREQLQNLREEHDTSVEELQASHEEVQSANEELQSLNEELETSNEELESANEELTTLNEELTTRNTELRESELRLREQTDLLDLAPVLARSPKDRVVFWNRGAERLYGFTKEEAVGQLSHVLLGTRFPEPIEKIQAEFARKGLWEGEVQHRCKDGRVLWVATQWVAHYDLQNKLHAVLEVNTDISARRAAEHALRESQEFNQRILESSPDCITVLDLAGRVTFMSASGLQLLGVADFAAIAHAYWPNLWIADSREAAEKTYRAALAGEIARFEGATVPNGDESRWWDVVARPMLGSDGRPEKILCCARDASQRRRQEGERALRERLAALRADVALEVSRPGESSPILHQIAEALVRHVDAAFARIWTEGPDGLVLAAAAGTHAHNHLAQDRLELAKVQRLIREQRPHLTNDLAHDPEIGDPTWVRREAMVGFAAYPLSFQNRVVGAVALFSRKSFPPSVLDEIAQTAETIAQFLLRQRADEERQRLLQDAVDSRNAAVAASRAKDDFIATLSHELRTPLNPVLLLASEGADNPELPDRVREDFKLIRNNVNLEAKLIDDLLDLTRITHGKLSLDMKALDAHTLLRDAIGIVAPNIEEKHLDLSLDLAAPRAVVLADAVRLQQVFWNVLINAVKFTPERGRIAVSTAIVKGDNRWEARFTDTGSGLSSTQLEAIFAPFSQGVNRVGGLGLGLAISRQLIEKHGGTITASSDGPGRGATFVISLPLLPVVPSPSRNGGNGHHARENGTAGNGKRPGASHPGPRANLLLIEDHTTTREAMEALLVRRNFRVTTAGSVAAALEAAGREHFDLVISDLGLPDGDGYTVWTELKTRHPHLVAIALSGYGMEHDVRRSREAGFAGHLTKPVTVHAVDRAIAAVLPLLPGARREELSLDA